MVSILMEFMVL
jgi:hypothetical protein